ncbi:MAG: LysM domain-containing protein, partial [Anaerolineae bacterium]|nr:LysM domain-containing protein [Anaerolineae bacterium]
FALFLSMACALSLAAALAASADGGSPSACPAYYVVQRGDTLNKIAAHEQMTLRELLRLNAGRVRNPDLIYPGQVLCVPAKRQVTLQVAYHITATQGTTVEGALGLLAQGNVLGREAVYRVQSVELFSTTLEITSTFAAYPPVLIGVRNQSDAVTYTLYAVGDGRALLPLVLTDTHSLTTVLPNEADRCNTRRFSLLAAGLSDVATATLHMETGNAYLPFDLTRVALHGTLKQAMECISQKDRIGFVIAPAGPSYPDVYRVVMRMDDHIVGPPGATRALKCSRWPVWGWFYRWLRRWYGC